MCGGEGVDGDDSLRRKDVRRYFAIPFYPLGRGGV